MESKANGQVIFQAETVAKLFSTELGPCYTLPHFLLVTASSKDGAQGIHPLRFGGRCGLGLGYL